MGIDVARCFEKTFIDGVLVYDRASLLGVISRQRANACALYATGGSLKLYKIDLFVLNCGASVFSVNFDYSSD